MAFLSVPGTTCASQPASPSDFCRSDVGSCTGFFAGIETNRDWPTPRRFGLAGDEWAGQPFRAQAATAAPGGHLVAPQRFAIDWFQLKTADARFTGDSKKNGNYKAYGADVLAVADATVAQLKDGIADNTPGEDLDGALIADDAELGNYVILDLGGGNYCRTPTSSRVV